MTKTANYTIYCNEIEVASTSGPDDEAQRHAFHYAHQYRQEGRVTIKRGKKLVAALSQTKLQNTGWGQEQT